MKTSDFYLFVITIVAIVCSSCHDPKGDLSCIDVRKNYPEKDFFLTDIAEISYFVPSSDDDGYLFSGTIRALTENSVVIADARSGDILFFNKDGTPKSRFNRRGNGPGEYLYASQVFYDEDTDEVFVSGSGNPRVLVFSSSGEYKREIPLPQGSRMGIFASFDDASFLYYDPSTEIRRVEKNYKDLPSSDLISTFTLISKEDGTVLDHIELPMAPIFLGIFLDGNPVSSFKTRLIKCTKGIFLCNPENDTVFLYGMDRSLTPVLHKIPLADATNPMTYLNNCVDIGDYQFMEVYTVRAGEVYPGRFPVKYYMRDKRSGEISLQKLFLPEYTGKEFIIGPNSGAGTLIENGVIFELDLLELREAFSENRLSGKLKELVETLKEDDNNVYAIVQFNPN